MSHGQLAISRCTGGSSGDYITIKVSDNKSGLEFLEVKVSCENFAKGITGLAGLPIQFELYGMDQIGKVRELKTEYIPTQKGEHKCSDEYMVKMAQKLEVTGWKCHLDELKNHHNWVMRNDKMYIQVTYVRFVKEKSQKKLSLQDIHELERMDKMGKSGPI